MESILNFIVENADHAHWVIFFLIMLAGINVPLSEDVLVLAGGAIGATFAPENTRWIFMLIFLGAWMSAWEAYWIGRLLGPKLYKIKWFGHILPPHRIERLHHYYEKFGILTFFIGRFIPGGVRNALFMTSGLGKMPFYTFIMRDFPACLLQVSVLFYLGHLLGENFHSVAATIKTYNNIFLIFFLLLLSLGTLWAYKIRKRN